MQRKDLSNLSLIVGAILIGSLLSATLSGCRPKSIGDIDTSTDVSSNATANNLTTNSSGVTAESPSTVPSTPVAAPTPVVASPTASDTETESAPKADAAQLVSLAKEVASPEQILNAAGDWPQWGGTRLRNNVSSVTGLPTSWNIGKFDRRTGEWDKSKAENIRWFAPLGSQTYGNPVVAGGRVFVGTNNGAGHLKRYPSDVDLGCLLAFDEKNGDFLWQHSSEKLITGRVHDWPLQGICCAPLVEGDRMWFVTSRGEVRCLDPNGFHDGEDDGPVTNEEAFVAGIMKDEKTAADHAAMLAGFAAGTLTDTAKKMLADAGEALEGDVAIQEAVAGKVWKATGKFAGVDRELTIKQLGPRINFYKALGVNDKQDADVVWVFNMMEELGTSQHNMCSCSVTCYGDLLFVNTSNGLDETHRSLPSPDAPSFFCMDKNTGEVHWTDKSPGQNILHGQWSSPTVAEFEGVPQVLMAGGDGILYSFAADKGTDSKPTLLWQFDCNPKTSEWELGGSGTRNNLIATPVAYDGRVYIAVGQDPEHGDGEGHLWCIDPTKRGDISPTLAMKVEDGKRVPIPHKRLIAVEVENGEVEVDNPNSGAIWHYHVLDQNDDGEIDFEEEMHRTIGTVAIKDDLLYISDYSGLVHCLDAKGTEDGKPIVHFTFDMLSLSWGSPLIADGRVFIGDEEGDVSVFELGAENSEPIEEIFMGSSVYSTPVAANGSIYISTKDKLFCIGTSE